MVVCPGCGTSVSEWASHCPACGTTTDPEHGEPGRPPERRDPRRFKLVAAAMTVVIAAGGTAWWFLRPAGLLCPIAGQQIATRGAVLARWRPSGHIDQEQARLVLRGEAVSLQQARKLGIETDVASLPPMFWVLLYTGRFPPNGAATVVRTFVDTDGTTVLADAQGTQTLGTDLLPDHSAACMGH